MILYAHTIKAFLLLEKVMNRKKTYSHVIDFVNELHAEGRYTFTKDEIAGVYQGNKDALKLALRRVVKKGRIALIRRGFYVVIPYEYFNSGILPPQLFIDDLMNFIGLPYYVALASAGTLYGASHQQVQALHVMIPKPRRDITAHGLKIRFFVKKNFQSGGRTKYKTDTGYIEISSPELTALDLVAYEARIGGIQRVLTILTELYGKMQSVKLADEAVRYTSITSAQRLGYLLELVSSRTKLTENLASRIASMSPPYTLLQPGIDYKKGERNARWKLIINAEVESEL